MKYTAPADTIHALPVQTSPHTHTLCTFFNVLPLTLPLITPTRHRKENENTFLFPLTPPTSPFFMVAQAGTPSGSTLGFKELLFPSPLARTTRIFGLVLLRFSFFLIFLLYPFSSSWKSSLFIFCGKSMCLTQI